MGKGNSGRWSGRGSTSGPYADTPTSTRSTSASTQVAGFTCRAGVNFAELGKEPVNYANSNLANGNNTFRGQQGHPQIPSMTAEQMQDEALWNSFITGSGF